MQRGVTKPTVIPNAQSLPRHVAIIMDGNGRWAKRQFLPRIAGHRTGVEVVRKITKACAEKGIEVLTLFAFSTENWQRPKLEVNALLDIFFSALDREVKKLHENNVQLRIIGSDAKYSPEMRSRINAAQQLTAQNTGLKLVIAFDYSGQWDIANASRLLAAKAKSGDIAPEQITPQLFEQYLSTKDLPEPDLFIRTSGERRISNFLLWQLAYTELYFTDVHWPDFTVEVLDEALNYFASRERRFGCTSEQLNEQVA